MKISWKDWKLRLASYALAVSVILNGLAVAVLCWPEQAPPGAGAFFNIMFYPGYFFSFVVPCSLPNNFICSTGPAHAHSEHPWADFFGAVAAIIKVSLSCSVFLYWGFFYVVFYAIAKRRLKKLKLS